MENLNDKIKLLEEEICRLKEELKKYKAKEIRSYNYEIYKVTNLKNNKIYIGKTTRWKIKRMEEHLKEGYNVIKPTLKASDIVNMYEENKNNVSINNKQEFYKDMNKYYKVETIEFIKCDCKILGNLDCDCKETYNELEKHHIKINKQNPELNLNMAD